MAVKLKSDDEIRVMREAGAIVGRTDGLSRNEFLASELVATDFRLSLEVKLTPDSGNSGVQFRSEALPGGEVKGYQADIGAGWWGKLYEEHGRALLLGERVDVDEDAHTLAAAFPVGSVGEGLAVAGGEQAAGVVGGRLLRGPLRLRRLVVQVPLEQLGCVGFHPGGPRGQGVADRSP